MKQIKHLAPTLMTVILALLMTSVIFVRTSEQPRTQLVEKIDTLTVVVHDTVTIVKPQPAKVIILPQSIRRLPLASMSPMSADTPAAAIDSADVIVPMETKVYEDSSYRAVISGAWVSLDTIRVYPLHEITTIRHPVPKTRHWAIGIGAGYGITPRGFQPWAGVTLTYTLWHF